MFKYYSLDREILVEKFTKKALVACKLQHTILREVIPGPIRSVYMRRSCIFSDESRIAQNVFSGIRALGFETKMSM